MIHECTDCRFCVSFEDGYRVICNNPNLPPNEVTKYPPVDRDGDARDCDGFEEGDPEEFSGRQFGEAEDYSEKNFDGEVTYPGILAWVKEELKKEDR